MSDFLNPHLTRPAVRWTAGEALPDIEATGKAAPLLVDATTGRLMVDTEANLTADLSDIESKQDITNANLAVIAADLAAPLKTGDASGVGITSTNVSGKQALDVNVVAGGGGGGGGGASAQYNATLPTYTSGDPATLQTDANGRLITTNANLANLDADLGNVADAAASSDTGSFSLIALTKRLLGKLTDGTQVVTSNNAASQVYNYTATGAVAAGTLIGPIDCSQFREISVQTIAVGVGTNLSCSVSNDGTAWNAVSGLNAVGALFGTGSIGVAGFYTFPLLGAKFFRVSTSSAQTSGTTTLVAYASQQATPKLYQQVSVTGTVGVNPAVSSNGFSLYHSLVSASGTNPTLIKTGGSAFGTFLATNTTASFKYIKIYNRTSAPTVGTDTPVLQVAIPPNSTVDVSSSYCGFRLANGFAYAITGGSGLLDATSVATGDVLINVAYF